MSEPNTDANTTPAATAADAPVSSSHSIDDLFKGDQAAAPGETVTTEASATATTALTDDPAPAAETPPPTPESKPSEAGDAKATGEADPKPAEPAKAPEKYDLKLPDGSSMDASSVENVVEFAKANNLTQDQAQAILDREHRADQAFAETHREAMQAQKQAWFESAKSDKEIGGDSFAANSELARRVVDRFASPELKQALIQTGFGNHPELIRVFTRLGKAMAEDTFVTPQKGGKAQPKADEDLFYPSTK